MEEKLYEEEEGQGLFQRVAKIFSRTETMEPEIEEEILPPRTTPSTQLKSNYRYTVTVRRHIQAFEDALQAANGLKTGEQQLINLCGLEQILRKQIVDFLSGVNYAVEGTWEEVGENVYLIVPQHAYVEVIPQNARSGAIRN
jgi:cell division inhibitor SepF